jgi:hypothetical protein
MATIGLYIRGDQESANALRARLNELAGSLGYVASAGPTAGEGNLAGLLAAIDRGDVVLIALSDDEKQAAMGELEEIDEPWAQRIVEGVLESLEAAAAAEYEAIKDLAERPRNGERG